MVAKFEGLGRNDRDRGAAPAAAIDRLAELEGKIKLEMTVERRRTIDVTPSGSRPYGAPPASLEGPLRRCCC